MSYDYDDVPDDVRREAEAERRYIRWRCPECGGGHGRHSQGCPEALAEEE